MLKLYEYGVSYDRVSVGPTVWGVLNMEHGMEYASGLYASVDAASVRVWREF